MKHKINFIAVYAGVFKLNCYSPILVLKNFDVIVIYNYVANSVIVVLSKDMKRYSLRTN